jgi:hypothetical protein
LQSKQRVALPASSGFEALLKWLNEPKDDTRTGVAGSSHLHTRSMSLANHQEYLREFEHKCALAAFGHKDKGAFVFCVPIATNVRMCEMPMPYRFDLDDIDEFTEVARLHN